MQLSTTDGIAADILDRVPVAIWVTNPPGDLTFVNACFGAITGLRREQHYSGGWAQLIHPDDFEGMASAYQQALANKEPFEAEFRICCQGDVNKWVLARGAPRNDPEGTFLGYLGAAIDIDARRRVEGELQEAQASQRRFLDVLPALAWRSAPDGTPTYLNENWLNFTGLTLEQAKREAWAAIHPDDIPVMRRAYREGQHQQAPVQFERRLRQRDGSYRWHLSRTAPVRDDAGTIREWIGASVDIDDRKHVEQALAASEAHYRALIEALPQLVWQCDALGNPTYVNQPFTDYTGLTAAHTLAEHRMLLQREDLAQVLHAWEVAQQSATQFDLEVRLRNRHGAYRWFLARVLPIVRQGEVTGWLASATDIHEHRQREREERLLAEIGAVLGRSLDVDETLQAVAECAVPEIGDYCLVDLVEDDDTMRRVAGAHRDPAYAETMHELNRHVPPVPISEHPIRHILDAGQAGAIIKAPSLETLHTFNSDPAWMAAIRGLNPRAYVVVPLAVHGWMIGAMTFAAASDPARRLTLEDVALAERVAERAAIAVSNAQAHTETARREQEERLLVGIGKVLNQSLDLDETLQAVANVVVPGFADCCFLDIRTPDGAATRVAAAHRDAAMSDLMATMRGAPPITSAAGAVRRALDLGEATFMPELTDEDRTVLLSDDHTQQLFDVLQLSSFVVVPLLATGSVLGALTLARAPGSRPYTRRELGLAGRIAELSALAVSNARAHSSAQHALAEKSEAYALLDALFENSPVGLALLDQDGRFVRINDRLAEMNGLPAEAHLGQRVEQLLPQFWPEFEPSFRRALAGEQLEIELTGETPAAPGVIRSWLENLYPVHGPGEDVIGVGVAILEITERKQAEQALAESEARHRAIGESVDYGIWVCDRDGRPVYISQSLLDLLGTTIEAFEETINTCVAPDELAELWHAWKLTRTLGAPFDREFRVPGPDGQLRTILSRGTAIWDANGRISGFAGINLDITHRKRVEDELRHANGLKDEFLRLSEQERSRFLGMVEATGLGVFQVTADGIIRYINPAGASMLGYEPDELTGRNAHETFHHHRPDGTLWPPEECPLIVARGRNERYMGEDTYIRKDGSALPVEVSNGPIVVDGQPAGSVVVFQDISDRLRLVHDREQFLAMAAHELRNPLTSILGFSRILARRAASEASGFDAEVRDEVQTLLDAAERMSRTTETYLDMARLDAGIFPLILEPVDLGLLIEGEATTLRRRHPHVALEEYYLDEDVVVTTDEVRTRQVIGNLLENAALFTGEFPEVTIRLTLQEDKVSISVHDNGPGIATEDREHVFERYYRGRVPHRGQRRGLGLGLYISKEIAGFLGGTLTFDSVEGKGTTFTLTLPYPAAEASS